MSGSIAFSAPVAHSEAQYFTRLLIGYCTGLSDLHVSDQASPADVGALLARHGRPELGQLLTQPLPPDTALILALDMSCGQHSSVRIWRAGSSHLEPRSESLAHSLTLTRLLLDVQQTYQAAYSVLFLVPCIPGQQGIIPLFPATAPMLAALPDPARIPLPPPGTWEQSLSRSVLNAVELTDALRSAREETGRVLQVLVAENCFLHSLELAYELQNEVEYMATIQSRTVRWLDRALSQVLDTSRTMPDQPGAWLRILLAQDVGLPDPGPDFQIGPGLTMNRIAHLYYLCSQFVTVIQDIWPVDRALQTLFLRARFQPQDPQNAYRDLFDFLHKIQFEMNRLSWTVLDQVDTVMLQQLKGAIHDILTLPQNQPGMFLEAGTTSPSRTPALPVYLPAGPLSAVYDLWQFRTSGWIDFIQLLTAARA